MNPVIVFGPVTRVTAWLTQNKPASSETVYQDAYEARVKAVFNTEIDRAAAIVNAATAGLKLEGESWGAVDWLLLGAATLATGFAVGKLFIHRKGKRK